MKEKKERPIKALFPDAYCGCGYEFGSSMRYCPYCGKLRKVSTKMVSPVGR
jgi:hypothetical protein